VPLDIVVGAQWGDEGKGRITDLLAARAQMVARYGGGDNAGHSITVGSQRFKLHLVPSGVIHPHVICLLGDGMVINPATLVDELNQLQALGLDCSPARIKLSGAAHVITPVHIALDGAEEAGRGQAGLGTTRRGIGPAYTDKAARRGIRCQAMLDPQAFGRSIEARVAEAADILPTPDPKQAGADYAALAQRLRPYVSDTGALVSAALDQGQTVLAEGAQGTLLDLDHGTYPYVTSSMTTAAGALGGLGVGARYVRRVIGVAKSFQTRVGAGPFPTEVLGEAAERLRGSGSQPWDEFGTTTGRPRRCGWLDLPLLRYAVRVNGLTELALTKLDVLAGLDVIPLGIAYRRDGHCWETPPAGLDDLGTFEPELEALPGWREDVRACRQWDDLPAAAQGYVTRIESVVGVPARLISVGPERDALVRREVA
jgi:adenylosuccinate synthase